MKIYHYTSIDTLEKILSNRMIRFNNLNNVDDLEERSYSPYSKYVFVSCWTDSPVESIPLWRMYTSDIRQGVRISLDSDMFKRYRPIKSTQYIHSKIEESLVDCSKFMDKDYFVNPVFGDCKHIDDNFFRRIEYVNNPKFAVGKVVQDVIDNGEPFTTYAFNRLGVYKHKCWEFQQEIRFTLYILPFNPMKLAGHDDAGNRIQKGFQAIEDLPFSDYYLALREEAINDMEITLSPNISDEYRGKVKKLLTQYAPKTKCFESSLLGKVKIK